MNMKETTGSIRIAIGRCRPRLVLAISGLALAGLSASVVPASASPAAPKAGIGTFIFATGAGHLRGGGHSWSAAIAMVSVGGSPRFNVIALGISTPHLGGTEEHTWGGQLGSRELSISSAAVMTINSQSSLSPVASLNLTFRPASRKIETRDCVTGSEVVYTGTLNGSMRLRTGMKGLTLSAAHLSFGSHNTLTVIRDCVFSPCHLTTWATSSIPPKTAAYATGAAFVVPGHTANSVTIQRTVTLPGKNRLTRLDLWTIAAKAPTFNKSSKSLTVTSSSSGLVTGAATLSHATPSGSPIGTAKICLFGGKKYTQTDTQYLHARYEPSGPFEAHTILNGTVKVQRSGTARFDIVTLKRK